MTRSTLTAVAIAASVSAPAYADTYQVDKQHTEAAFQVRHLFTKVRGVFRDVDGTIRFDKANPADSNVVFRLKVASIDTGVDQRDNHLRSQDFFWAEKYPEISFTSSRGPTGDGRLKPDLLAPGERIVSCAAGRRLPTPTGDATADDA